MADRSWRNRLHSKLEALRMLRNWRGWWFFAQRRLLRPSQRLAAAGLIARLRPRPASSTDGRAATWQRQLRDAGCSLVTGLVAPEQAARMRDYFRAQPVFAPYLPGRPRTFIGREPVLDTHVLWHDDKAVLGCPHALAIANHPEVLAAVEGLLGCRPTLSYLTAWWSVPTADGKPREAENFHRDVDDLAFIKFFIYLTDVDETNGPHVYVRGSHKCDALLKIRRYTDNEVLAAFGALSLVRFKGPAGTAFLENTFGLHRGEPVATTPRLVLQAVYSQMPMPYSPPRAYPVAAVSGDAGALDPYVNRLYVRA